MREDTETVVPMLRVRPKTALADRAVEAGAEDLAPASEAAQVQPRMQGAPRQPAAQDATLAGEASSVKPDGQDGQRVRRDGSPTRKRGRRLALGFMLFGGTALRRRRLLLCGVGRLEVEILIEPAAAGVG